MASCSLKKFIYLTISVVIYAFLAFKSLPIILLSLFISYFGAFCLEKHHSKLVLCLLIIFNSAIFLSFKFSFLSSVLVPLGLAYYTLQIISYLVDVYQKKYHACHNFLDYALYIFYLPCLFLGPINRFNEFQREVATSKFTKENFSLGFFRILWGLFKKLIIAGRATILLNNLTSFNAGGAYALVACLLYSLLLYADFSGGIDIVLGFSRILGLNLPENFNQPFSKTSVKEFWQSWHMSLSRFLKDYIYIPLGGNRKGKLRQKINTLITFLVSGLWHGLNYIFWGLFNGILVAFLRLTKTKYPALNRLIMFILISLLWIFFIYPDTITAFKMLISIFTTFNYGAFFSNILNLGLDIANYIVLIIASLSLFIEESFKDKLLSKLRKASFEKKIVLAGILILIIILYGIYGIGFEVTDFIYSKF